MPVLDIVYEKTRGPKKPESNTVIYYGSHATPFGLGCIGFSNKGICYLSFGDEGTQQQALKELEKGWPGAEFREDSARAQAVLDAMFKGQGTSQALTVHLRGTDFQLQVWKALLTVNPGQTTNYEEIACLSGRPKAVRAAASAVANNAVAYLVPCHRVIRKSGQLGQYRWGPDRKRAMLNYEQNN